MNTIKNAHLYLIKRSFVSVLFGLLLFFQAANSWAISTQSGYGTVLVYETCWDSYDYMAKAYADNVLIHAGMDAAGLVGYKSSFYHHPSNGNHTYRIDCFNDGGGPSPTYSYSTTSAWPPEPTTLSTTQGTQIALSWTASTGATSYEIYRSTTSGQLGNFVSSASSATYSYIDTTISNGGFYYYNVIPKAYNVWGPYSSQVPGWRQLPAPASLSATQGTLVNSVGLSWTSVVDASGYDVYRSATFGTLGSLLAQTASTNYIDTASGYGSAYYYTVKASLGGVAGNPSSQQSGWGKAPLPDQTTGVNATKGSLYAKVAISWSPANNATAYTLYKSTTSGSLGSQLASNITGTSYDDTTVSGTTVYYYTVVSVSSTGTGLNSAQVNGWGKVPAILSTLTATQGTLIGKVTLNWASNPDATGYEVWRSSTSGGSYAYLTTVTPVTFNDIAISGTTHYFYKVKVVVGTLLGSLSNEAEGWAKINYPVKVPSISATQGTLYGKSTVSWSAATDASTYNLFRSISLGTKGALVVSGLAGLSYDDNTVSSGTHYFYTVVSVNNTGNGPDSDQAEGWGKVPSILSNLAATQGTLSGKVRLTWTNDPDATGYEVYRSTTSGGAASLIATATAPASSYDDSSVLTSNAYYYTIKVKVGAMAGAPSAEASGWRMLPVVATLTATQGTLTGKVRLTWAGEPEAMAYEFYRSATVGGTGTLLSTVASSSTFYDDTTTGAGTAYYYTMKVKVGGLKGNASNEAAGWGKLPNTIADLTATQGTLADKIRLIWTDNPEATGYEIYRSGTSGGASALIATATAATYDDVSITASTPYYYTVKTKVGTLVGNPGNEAFGWRKLPAIADLTATQGTLVGKVGLTWTADPEATSYEIFRSATSGGAAAKIGTSTTSIFDDTTLTTSNQYYYTVKVKIGATIGAASNQASGYRKLPMVSDLSATKGTLTGKVGLAWSSASEATGYEIWRSSVQGQVGALLYALSSGTINTYEDTTAGADTTYNYTVKVKVGSLIGYPGNEAAGWGKLPNTLSTLTATQGTLIGNVKLTWLDDPEATSYEIYRSATSGGAAMKIGTSTVAGFDDTNSGAGITYYYTVKTVVASLVGASSNEASGWGKLPDAINSLSATQGTLVGKVGLTWTKNNDATAYEIVRSDTSGGATTLLSSVSSTSYYDQTATASSKYYYTVKVKVGSLASPPSNEAIGWRKLPVISDLSATQGTLDGKVGLTWTTDPEATSYEIYRSATPGGTVTKIGTSTTATFYDTTTPASKPYYYKVVIKITDIPGDFSNEASGYRKLPLVSDLSATKGTLTGKVGLAWSSASEATGYEIWRSPVQGQAGLLISSVIATDYEDTTVGAGTTYYYTIKTKVGSLIGYIGNEADGWGKLPNTLSTLSATQGSLIGKVQLSWAFDAEAVSYEIWRSTTPSSGYQLLGSSLNAAYEDSTALDPTPYYYTVKIKTANLTGNPSNEASGWSRLPNVISTLTATQGGFIAKVRLKWALDKEATHYEVWRATTPQGVASLLNTLPSSAISYDDTAIEPDKPYYYTIKVKVGQLVGPLSNEASGFAKAIPPAPTINFKGGVAITAGKFYVPVGQKVTSLAPSSTPAPTEKMKITMTQNGETYERTDALSGVLYPISAPNLSLLEERAIHVRVAWQNFPDVYNEQTITAVGGTKNNLKLITETPISVADTEPLIVKLKLGEYTKNGIAYDPATMGQWQTQLLVQTNSQPTNSPGTALIDMVNGQAEFSLNPAGNQFMKITAVSRLVSTVPGLNVNLIASTKYVQVVKGTPIEGTISSKQFDAPAPKSFTLNLEMSPDNRVALKTATWEESSDNGATWDAIPDSVGTRKSILMPDPERKQVRVKMVNKNTLVESYTDPVELLAYSKLTVFITGPRHAAPGTAAVLSADVYKDGFKINDPIVEWTVGYSAGKQYLSGPTASVSESQEGKLSVTMRARSQDTRPDDANAWAYYRYVVTFKNPSAPTLSVTGPRDVETGKTYHYQGGARPSWGGVQSALAIVSEWELPDGSISAGNGLDWTPSAQELANPKPLIFRAWVDGFKDSTVSERTLTYSPWMYVWPNFTVSLKQLTAQAPSDIALMVNHDQPAMSRRFEGLTYNWAFPANMTGRQNDAFPNRAAAQALYAGEYDVSVTIQDTRGHETVLTQHIVTEQAAPYAITLKVGKSNIYDRVPMTVTVRPNISGGHPLDSVSQQIWKIDNQTISDYTNRNFLYGDIPTPGDHVVSYTMLSKMGIETVATATLSLVPNEPPVCQLYKTDNSLSVYVDAKCTDSDGKVIGYSWEVDGQPIGSTSYRISFPKSTTPQSATVTIRGMDDAKDLSAPVSINVSY